MKWPRAGRRPARPQHPARPQWPARLQRPARKAAAAGGRVQWGLLAALALGAGVGLWWWGAAAPGPSAGAAPAAAHAGSAGVVAGAAARASGSMPAPMPVATPLPARAAATAAAASGAGPPLSALGQQQRRERLTLAQDRLQRANEALAAYQQAARYPHGSRPISEHPDQVRPFAPIEEEAGLRLPGTGAPTQGVRLRTSQERVFASGLESNRITLTLQDSQGRTLPLRITRGVLRQVAQPGVPASRTETQLLPNDAGSAGDAVAGDGVYTAVVQPATQGFADVAGLLRLELNLEYAGQPGFLYFDLVYSPTLAARWLPGVADQMDAGSLVFVLPVQVLLAGRYLVSGRVDDALGKPFALASFNGDLAAGNSAFRLPVFGKLVHDLRPALPLQLRDVEAFLLKPDTYPDRVMLPRLAGVVHRSAQATLAAFSSADWTSEERERYLAELGKDVAEAQAQVDKLGP